MSDGTSGPSTAELGLTQKDLGVKSPEDSNSRTENKSKVLRAPKIDQWLATLEGSKKGDQAILPRLQLEFAEISNGITDKNSPTDEYTEILTKRNEVQRRVDNQHLKTNLPRQIAQMLSDPEAITPDSKAPFSVRGDIEPQTPEEKAELAAQIVEAIREGNIEAICRGLSALQSSVSPTLSLHWLKVHELGKDTLEGRAELEIVNRLSVEPRKLDESNEGIQRKMRANHKYNSMDVNGYNQFFVRSWPEILSDPSPIDLTDVK